MKLNKLALTLTAAALLPTFAYAAADPVTASFDRDLQRGAVIGSILTMNDTDPLLVVNEILNREPDAVVASFDRDLYRAPGATRPVMFAGTADPLGAINIAFRGNGEADAVLASFERDLHRVPTIVPTMIVAQADPLVEAIYVAFYGTETSGSLLASFERDLRRTFVA
jgi:hypothetical protein